MSPIIRSMLPALLVIMVALSFGCGDKNSKVAFDAETGDHPVGWAPAGHANSAKTNSASCRECHGMDLGGGTSNVACSECHTNGSPYEAEDCTSCHSAPPSGAAEPNRAGAHAAHMALPNVTCAACHDGAGSESLKHADGTIDLNFKAAFNAKSGTAVYNADGTCSKVSCHGGQTTPGWLSGQTIDVTTQCSSCHAYGTSEYNSYASGQHNYHVNVRQWQSECWRCHDDTTLADVHFSGLNSTALDGQAYLTLNSATGYDKNTGKCLALCHSAYIRGW